MPMTEDDKKRDEGVLSGGYVGLVVPAPKWSLERKLDAVILRGRNVRVMVREVPLSGGEPGRKATLLRVKRARSWRRNDFVEYEMLVGEGTFWMLIEALALLVRGSEFALKAGLRPSVVDTYSGRDRETQEWMTFWYKK